MHRFWAYRDMYDAADNWIGANGAFVDNPQLHLRDQTTIDSLWFDSGSSIRYFYYSEILETKKTQWTDIPLAAPPSGGDAWTSDSSWNVVRPTLDKVVKNWSDTTPLVVLQTYESNFATDSSRVYLPAPELTKTLTKDKWFYSETDGYFYYLGVLNHNESVSAPMDVKNPVNKEAFFTEFPAGLADASSPIEFVFRVYGEALEANKDAVASAWGLTFEPGSLGAAIFG
ncbi:MAG: hypothetical protein FWC27_06765 [Firmicutes bacterium]|nr:hypothetical protein [Bacillota bacterium]